MRDPVLSIGSIFEGRYEIVAQLGEGSFGRVYRGRQGSTGQTVAIKILRLWQGDSARDVEDQIARFRREMRLCAELSHPNIVRLIDSGESEDGTLYTVFEYVPGSTLREVLAREGSLGWELARHLMTQVLDALACAHARGVVHRDLKPENIMVTQTGAQRHALVLDFGLGGIAREVENWSLPRLTATREILGTPAYAAPEQLRGEPVSTRSDLYAWGLILLECLTGELALRGQSMHEVIFQQISPEPVPIPPSIRNGRLRRLLQKVTTKQIARRDVTIEALLQTLTIINAEERDVPFAGAGAIAAATPSAAEGERRQLTVLFCDLVGSTELSARLDPEEFRDIVQAYHRTTEVVIVRFGGHVGKYLGDGLLAYFGWPKAREDDAERAVRAGLALPGAIDALNERLPPGVRLAVRVGMHTGTVVVGEDVFGETPNLAARVQQAASPDTVVITAETHKLVAGLFVVEECDTHTLRGVPEPVTLYRVVQPSGIRSRFRARATRGLTHFVGREHETRLLSERWQRAHEGEGQVVLITGEPGIGKSRLVQALEEEIATEPHTRIECQGAPLFQNTAFHPVEEMFRQGFAWRGDESAAERLQGLERALELAGVRLPEAVPLVAPLLNLPVPEHYRRPLPLSPALQRRKLLATLAAWLFGATRAQPILFVLEDLHWVDASTLELLGLLAEQGAMAPLLLLFTARPEFSAPWRSRAHHAQVTLNRLSRREARAMVTSVAGEIALPAETVETLVSRTDGVPLFIEELTRLVLQRSGEAGERAGTAVWEIPATLEGSLRARLDQLGQARDVAQVAAVIGRDFSYSLLQRVLRVRAPELQAALDVLVDDELIYARGVPPEATYLFKHALVQEASYNSLLKRTRQELHGRVVRALEEHFPERVAAEPELAARHAEAADRPADAVRYYRLAGLLARRRSSHEEAVRMLRRAIRLLATLSKGASEHAAELEMQIDLAGSLAAVRGYAHEEVGAAAERAVALSEPDTDPAMRGLALGTLATFEQNRGAAARAAELGARVIALAADVDDEVLRLMGHVMVGSPHHYLGRFASSLAHCEEAIAGYARGTGRELLLSGTDLYVASLGHLGWDLWHLGHPDRAIARAREAVSVARALDDPFSLGFALLFEAATHQLRRDRLAVRERAAELIALSEAQDFPLWLGVGKIFRGAAAGDPNAGLADILDGLGVAGGTGSQSGAPALLVLFAECQRLAGQAEPACGTVDTALELSARTGQAFWDAELHRLRGETLLSMDTARAPDAEEAFRQALGIAREQGTRALELRAATSLARLFRHEGRRGEARSVLGPVYNCFTEGFDTGDIVEAKALLEELA